MAPETDGRYSEAVGLTAAILGALQDERWQVVLDVGGDVSGAKALGRYAGYLDELGYVMHFVVNPFRPGTTTPGAIAQAVASIERSSRLRVSSLVSNPNLMEETTVDLILAGHQVVQAAAEALCLPVRLLCVEASLVEPTVRRFAVPAILPIYRHFWPYWSEKGPRRAAVAAGRRGRS